MIKQHRRTERIIFAGLIIMLIFAPLAFGSHYLWAYTAMEIGMLFLLALHFFDQLVLSKSSFIEWIKTPLNLPILIFLIFILAQMIPLPSFLMAFISPQTHADKIVLSEVIAKALGKAESGWKWMSAAYYHHLVIREWLKLFSYAAMFFLVLHHTRSKKRIDILVYALVVIGIFESFYAIFQVFSQTPKVWWWISQFGIVDRASGTFTVPNHFAFYMEIVICITLGFMLAQRKPERRVSSGLKKSGILRRVVNWLSPESASPKMIFLFFGATLMVAGLMLSDSRGGMFCFGGAMVLVNILFLTKKRYRRYGGLILIFCIISIGYGFYIRDDPTLKRFERAGIKERIETTMSILPMIRDYPLTGIGLGNFIYLYSRYELEGDLSVYGSYHAHNDWVEAIIESGGIGGILLIVGYIGYIIVMIRTWRKRRDPHAIGIGAGVIAAFFCIGLHSFFDFSIHKPANPLTIAAIAALGYSAINRHGYGYSESFTYSIRQVTLNRFLKIGILCVAFFCTGVAVFFSGRHFIAEQYCPTEWNPTLNFDWEPFLTDIEKAIKYNPGNADYYLKRVQNFTNIKISDYRVMKELNDRIIADMEQALILNPGYGRYWQELGNRYWLKKYDPARYLTTWLVLSDRCFDMAVQFCPLREDILIKSAQYWVWRSMILPKTLHSIHWGVNESTDVYPFSRAEGIRKFQELFQRALRLNPERWKWAVDRVMEYYPDEHIIMGIVPPGNTELESKILKESVQRIK